MKTVNTYLVRSSIIILSLGFVACGKMQSNKVRTSSLSLSSQIPLETSDTEHTNSDNNNSGSVGETTTPIKDETMTTKTPDKTPVVEAAFATNYDVFHPIKTNVVMAGYTQVQCSNETSALFGVPVQCKIGGGCDGTNSSHMGACFLAPLRKDLRYDENLVKTIYTQNDLFFPKGWVRAQFLKHLYKTVLQREPDVEGFYYWINEHFNNNGSLPSLPAEHLANGIILAQVNSTYWNAYNVNTANVEAFLQQAYMAAFNRSPDTGGFKYWKDALLNYQITPLGVLKTFYMTDEFKAFSGN